MTLTMEIISLIVRTAPVDDADYPVFKVLRVDSCSVRTLYHFQFNLFLIKLPFCFYNNVGNQSFFPNPINKMKTRAEKQLYRLGLVTIPCNNHDYLKK